MKSPIAIGLAPNFQKQDVLLSLLLLFMPWLFGRRANIEKLERWFESFFHVTSAVSFLSGRGALYALLHCLGIKRGDEVILQAFTCVVVPNAILSVGATPVYVDIDRSLTMDVSDLKRKITKQTKAIIVQHTFGIPSAMEEIVAIASKHNILLIEDVAHTIGGSLHGKKLGTFGIASIFSFGRDKAFSSVWGGVALTHDASLGESLRAYQKKKHMPSQFWVWCQLWYVVLSQFILSFYFIFSIGRIFHFLLNKIRFFSMPVNAQEKEGIFDEHMVYQFPSALASLALKQLERIHPFNDHRRVLSALYSQAIIDPHVHWRGKKDVPLLRYPVYVHDKKNILMVFSQRTMYLGNWYTQVIDPPYVPMARVGYVRGSCPVSEEMCMHIINLPTYQRIKEDDVNIIIQTLNEYS